MHKILIILQLTHESGRRERETTSIVERKDWTVAKGARMNQSRTTPVH